jgi:hypothetical protein
MPAEAFSPTPRRVGGSPTFVAAHGIAAERAIPFEQAFALARLVLDHGGGPVAFTGKKATITKALVMSLTHLGLVEVAGSSAVTQRMYVSLNVDGRIAELLDAKYAGVTLKPGPVREKVSWVALATQAGFDLVASHLP